jgi:hypothetical protein
MPRSASAGATCSARSGDTAKNVTRALGSASRHALTTAIVRPSPRPRSGCGTRSSISSTRYGAIWSRSHHFRWGRSARPTTGARWASSAGQRLVNVAWLSRMSSFARADELLPCRSCVTRDAGSTQVCQPCARSDSIRSTSSKYAIS